MITDQQESGEGVRGPHTHNSSICMIVIFMLRIFGKTKVEGHNIPKDGPKYSVDGMK